MVFIYCRTYLHPKVKKNYFLAKLITKSCVKKVFFSKCSVGFYGTNVSWTERSKRIKGSCWFLFVYYVYVIKMAFENRGAKQMSEMWHGRKKKNFFFYAKSWQMLWNWKFCYFQTHIIFYPKILKNSSYS